MLFDSDSEKKPYSSPTIIKLTLEQAKQFLREATDVLESLRREQHKPKPKTLCTGLSPEDRAKHNFAIHGGNLLEMKKDNGRRCTRLTRQIMIEITSLEPACDFRGEYTTVVVNAQGCGVIVREQLRKELSVMVKLVTNGRSNKGHVVLSIPLSDTSSWLTGIEFDSPSNFWEIADPPADWPLS
jgi:hypothetical protein